MGEEPVPPNGSDRGARLAPVPRLQEETILAALGDPQSRALLLGLHREPRSAQELAVGCSLPPASVYRKLKELQDAGLVGVQRSALTADGHRTELYRSLLVEARLNYLGDRLEVLAAFRGLAAERLGEMWDAVRGSKKR